MATYLAETQSSGQNRISGLEINLNTVQLSDTQIQELATLELNNLVTVDYTPNRLGAAIAQTCIVQGIAHSASPGFYVIRLATGATDGLVPFIWDDPVYGLWDSESVFTF